MLIYELIKSTYSKHEISSLIWILQNFLVSTCSCSLVCLNLVVTVWLWHTKI